MQLKRETDFAVRILFCLNKCRIKSSGSRKTLLTLTEIASQTGVPKTVAGRICDYLIQKGIIESYVISEKQEKGYCPTDEFLDFSLLDVIDAVEGTAQLFSVFDKGSPAYKCCEAQIQGVHKAIEKTLTDLTLRFLFQNEERA